MAASVARIGIRALCGTAIVAALVATSTAKAGLIGTGSASYCDSQSAQTFSRWGDSSYYASLYNNGFEAGSTGWSLSGGAKVVSGNESFYVRNARDSHSLLLPSGSSAMSATVCFALGDWHMRFFAKNVGSRTGSLRVQVVVPSLLGSAILAAPADEWRRYLGVVLDGLMPGRD